MQGVHVAALIAVLLNMAPGSRCAQAADAEGMSLLQDADFQRGFDVWRPEQGKIVVEGTLRTGWTQEEPVWRIAQWYSRFTLAGKEALRGEDGSLCWADPAKRVAVAPCASGAPGLVIAMNAVVEWEGRARAHGERWPQILIGQRVTEPGRPDAGCPPLGALRALPLHFEARLSRARREEPAGYNSRIHAAQFLAYVTLQDLDRASPGFGDYVYLGVRAYDDRHEYPPRSMTAGDYGGGKFIYHPPGSAYTQGSMHSGEWDVFEADLLPLAREAVQAAQDRGFLKNTPSCEGLRIGGFSIGWEVPGVNDVEAQVRALSLRAVPKSALPGAACAPRLARP